MKLKSNRKYLLNAFRDWLNEQGKTPFLVADASHSGVEIPPGFAQKDGRICLDISTNMVRSYTVTSSLLTFEAQFKGSVHKLKLPLGSLLAMRCKESSWSIWFTVFDNNEHVEPPIEPPKLRIAEDD